MSKIDFKKKFKDLYNPPAIKPVIVDIPEMNFIMIDGEGNPNNSESFQDAVESLYAVSYKVKFNFRRFNSVTEDYVVPPLEGLWWCNNLDYFSLEHKEDWKWTLMVMQPEFVSGEDIIKALAEVSQKNDLKAIERLRFDRFIEGKSAQIMHVGPYSSEAPTIEKLHDFINEYGYQFAGKHHEIYLSDPRKAEPGKLKTIIRQPFTIT